MFFQYKFGSVHLSDLEISDCLYIQYANAVHPQNAVQIDESAKLEHYLQWDLTFTFFMGKTVTLGP